MEINPKFKVGDKVKSVFDGETIGIGEIQEVIVEVRYKVKFKGVDRPYKEFEDQLYLDK